MGITTINKINIGVSEGEFVPIPADFLNGKVLSGRVYPEFFPFEPTDTVLNVGCGYAPQAIAYKGRYQQMIGIDITVQRLIDSLSIRETQPMGNYVPLAGDVEQLPFADGQFDKAIAIDIIEHVRHPQVMCQEINRILKPQGLALITIPTLHDHYTEFFSWISRQILRRKSKGTFHDSSAEWHPDAHNSAFSVQEWIRLIEDCGFAFIDSRATTLFPPLHLYGVPRFWFKSDAIHRIDRFLGSQALFKHYGQGLMMIFQKV